MWSPARGSRAASRRSGPRSCLVPEMKVALVEVDLISGQTDKDSVLTTIKQEH